MHNMAFLIVLHDGHQDVFSGQSVVLIGIVNSFQRFHGIRGGPLFGQMCNNVWFKFCKGLEELALLVSNVDL